MRRFALLSFGLCLTLSTANISAQVIAGKEQPTAGTTSSHTSSNSELDLLLRRLAEDPYDPYDLQSDNFGRPISIALRSTNANDHSLSLVSSIGSLQELSIYGRGWPTNRWTVEGISHLRKITNLTTLRIACLGAAEMNTEFLTQVCEMKGLKSLYLVGAPQEKQLYAAITNLQNLTNLCVCYMTNFGDAEITSLTNLPNLRSLELTYDAVTSEGTNVLANMPHLTNAILRFRNW